MPSDVLSRLKLDTATHNNRIWLAPLVVLIVALTAYIPSWGNLPLLDEQLLLNWARKAGSQEYSWVEFLSFSGLFPSDLWFYLTPLSVKISQALSFGAVWLFRIHNTLVHALTAILLFYAAKRLAGVQIALLGAVFFALWPTNVESVAWIGGRGALLSGLLIVAALAAYLKSRDVEQFQYGVNWTTRSAYIWLVFGAILFGLSLFATAAMWPMCLLFAACEGVLWFSTPPERRERSGSTFSLIAPLLFLVIAAATAASTGIFWNLTTGAGPVFSWKGLGTAFGALAFPINPSLHSKTAHHVKFFAALLIPVAVAALASMGNAVPRRLLGFCVVWLALGAVPFIGHLDVVSFAGTHHLYVATIPFCLMIASGCVGFQNAFGRSFRYAVVLTAVFALLLVVAGITHTWKQIGAYRAGGKVVRAMHKSLKVVREKSATPYVVASGIPFAAAVSTSFVAANSCLFDPGTGVVASSRVSGGHLKDLLKVGRYAASTLRWDNMNRSFANIDFGQPLDAPKVYDGAQVALMFNPPIEHYKTAKFDTTTGEIILNSNSPTSGPVIRFNGSMLAPLGEDFVWVDAMIDGPREGVQPTIEFYWQSPIFPEFDAKNRRVVTPVFLSDGLFHRYYLPLRSVGWVTSGTMSSLMMGFPAGSKVRLKGMGTTGKENLIPAFQVVASGNAGASNERAVIPPAFDFPNDSSLGLVRLPRAAATVPVTYSSAKPVNATGVLVEISMPNKDFDQANSTQLSSTTLKTIPIDGTTGTYQIPVDQFPEAGIYAIRAIAMDKLHNMFGNFSDTWYVYVYRPKRTGWNE